MENDAIDNTTSHDDEDWLEFLMSADQTEVTGDSADDLGERLMHEYMEEWGERDHKARSYNCRPAPFDKGDCSGTVFDEEFELELNRILEQQPKPERRGFFRRMSSSALEKTDHPQPAARRSSWFATTKTFLRGKSKNEIKKEKCPVSPSLVDTVSLTEDSTWDLSDMGDRFRAYPDEENRTPACGFGLDGEECGEKELREPDPCDTGMVVAGSTNWWEQWKTNETLRSWSSIDSWKNDNFQHVTSLIERVSSDTMKEVEILGTLVTESFDRLVVKPTIEATSTAST